MGQDRSWNGGRSCRWPWKSIFFLQFLVEVIRIRRRGELGVEALRVSPSPIPPFNSFHKFLRSFGLNLFLWHFYPLELKWAQADMKYSCQILLACWQIWVHPCILPRHGDCLSSRSFQIIIASLIYVLLNAYYCRVQFEWSLMSSVMFKMPLLVNLSALKIVSRFYSLLPFSEKIY